MQLMFHLCHSMKNIKYITALFLAMSCIALLSCNSADGNTSNGNHGTHHILGPEMLASYIESDKPVLVDFNASWCAPCKTMHPIVAEISNTYESKLTVVSVDVDDFPEWAEKYHIQSLPTFIVFKKGKMLWSHEGSTTKEDFNSKLENALQSAQ